MPAGRMINWSASAHPSGSAGPPQCDVAPEARPRARSGAVPGSTTLGRAACSRRLGVFRPRASVSRRNPPGQTRSPARLCSRLTGWPAAVGGPQHLYCRTCDQTTHCDPSTRPWVSLRDRRDARPDADHLLRHPDLRRPAVPDPPAVDGDDARAGSVRPRRQADAALRHATSAATSSCSRRRRAGPRTTARRRTSSGSSASAATRSRSTTARSFVNGIELVEPYVFKEDDGSAQDTEDPLQMEQWTVPDGRAVPDGRPSQELGRFARVRHGRGRQGDRARLAPLLADQHPDDPADADPSGASDRRRREPRPRRPRLRRRGGGGRRGLGSRGPGGAARPAGRPPRRRRSSPIRCPVPCRSPPGSRPPSSPAG